MALKIDPVTGQVYDDDPVSGWRDVNSQGVKSNSMFAADIPGTTRRIYNSTGTGMPGAGGVGWLVSGLGGAPGGGASSIGASYSMTPATASYTAPRAVDQTNTYENRLKALLDNPDSIANTGAYKFRFNQGQQALERSAAAKGMSGSGNLLAELAKYGQGMASQAYDTEADRLGNLSGQQKNYILGLMGAANTEAATANQFNLGNVRNVNDFTLGAQRNANDWTLGNQRNNIAYLQMQNDALNNARRYSSGSSAPAPTFNPGGQVW